jgi:hypothetical protein
MDTINNLDYNLWWSSLNKETKDYLITEWVPMFKPNPTSKIIDSLYHLFKTN